MNVNRSDPNSSHLKRVLDYLTPSGSSSSSSTSIAPPQEGVDSSSEELKLTSPLLAQFERKGILKEPFRLTPDEEGLIIQIVRDTTLPPALPLFMVLCFDLYTKMLHFASFIQEEDSDRLLNEFREKWCTIISKEELQLAEFLDFINKLNLSYVRSLHQKNLVQLSTAPTDADKVSLQRSKDGNGRLIMGAFICRTALLAKFINQPTAHPLLFKHPLHFYAGCQEIESHASDKTLEPISRISDFFEFLFDSACMVDATLRDPEKRAFVKNTIEAYAHPLINNQAGKAELVLKQCSTWLNDRVPFLFPFLQLLLKGCEEHQSKVKFYSREQNSQVMLGISPSVNDRFDEGGNEQPADKLARFRAIGIAPSTFSLTTQEERLLETLFQPLDSELTLMDLLAFSLDLNLEQLCRMIPAGRVAIVEIQSHIGAFSYGLYFGFARFSKDATRALGSPAFEARKYCLSPEDFIEKLDGWLALLRPLISSSSNRKINPIDRKIIQIRNLWVKLLRSQDPQALLCRSISRYVGAERMDQDNSQGKKTLKRYWLFHKRSYEKAVEEEYVGINRSIEAIDELLGSTSSTEPKRRQLIKFRQGIRNIVQSQLNLQKGRRRELGFALQGNLTNEIWLANHGITSRKKSGDGLHPSGEKSQLEFIEQLFQNVANVDLNVAIVSDFLRLAEKRIFPEKTITTRSCYLRLVHNLILKPKREDPRQELACEDIQEILSSLLAFFETPAFLNFLEFFQDRLKLKDDYFNYSVWLEALIPLEEEVESLFNKTLRSLTALPLQIRKKLKEKFKSLSLEELQKINPETIREALFNDCKVLIRPLLILSDILALLQKRHFEEEAEIIPYELADIMDMEGIEEILHREILSKTAQIPIPKEKPHASLAQLPNEKNGPSLPKEEDAATLSTSSSSSDFSTAKTSQPAQEAIKGLPHPKKGKKEQPLFQMNAAPSSSRPASEEDSSDAEDRILSIKKLKKAREILDRLKSLGLFEVSQKGSHIKMQSESGGQVIIPNHSNVAKGTALSIMKRTQELLKK